MNQTGIKIVFMKDWHHIKWTHVSRFLLIITATIGISGLYFSYAEIRTVRLNQSADLVLRFSEYLEKEGNLKIIRSLEENKPILVENGGEATWQELDSFLNIFETINNLDEHKIVNDDMIYNSFAYYSKLATNNQEIKNYVKQVQNKANDTGIYKGFLELGVKLSD